jgi:hypothetical protein
MSYSYYAYKSEKFTCSKCNWSGLGAETFLGDISENHTLRDIECPDCEHTLYTFDLAKVREQNKQLGNPPPEQKVCFNCKHMLWMVGVGQGVKCGLTKSDIPGRLYSCDKFDMK